MLSELEERPASDMLVRFRRKAKELGIDKPLYDFRGEISHGKASKLRRIMRRSYILEKLASLKKPFTTENELCFGMELNHNAFTDFMDSLCKYGYVIRCRAQHNLTMREVVGYALAERMDEALDYSSRSFNSISVEEPSFVKERIYEDPLEREFLERTISRSMPGRRRRR